MRRMGLPNSRITAVSTAAIRTSMVVQLPNIFSAVSLSPFPIMMDALGAPPMLTNAAKAEMAIIRGMVTPTPVSALGPTSAIWPIYIRSTMLYMTLIICARIAGRASLKRSFPILLFPRSASFSCVAFIIKSPFQIQIVLKRTNSINKYTEEVMKCQSFFPCIYLCRVCYLFASSVVISSQVTPFSAMRTIM